MSKLVRMYCIAMMSWLSITTAYAFALVDPTSLVPGDVLAKDEGGMWMVMKIVSITTKKQESSMVHAVMYQMQPKRPEPGTIDTLQTMAEDMPVPLATFADEGWHLVDRGVEISVSEQDKEAYKRTISDAIDVKFE